MNELVSKRYVKALIEGRDINYIDSISTKLNEISKAFSSEKFNSIIFSPQISDNEKVKLITSFTDEKDIYLNNFIKLLGEKRRFDILPFIAKDLNKELSRLNNTYIGIVYLNEKLSNDYLLSIEKQFSKKFNINLSLLQDVCDYDGIKVDIEGLGIEISFSKDKLKSKLIDHILKAV